MLAGRPEGALEEGDGRAEEFVGLGKLKEQFGRGASGARIAEAGSDLGERDEDEGALAETGVRDFEIRLAEDKVAVEEDVEVEGAGAVGGAGHSVTAEFELDGKKFAEQPAGSEIGFKGDDGVEETGLIGESHWHGGVERRTGGDAAKVGEACHYTGECGIGRAGGAGQIGTEGDVGEGHYF
jgi:hypothetical protein